MSTGAALALAAAWAALTAWSVLRIRLPRLLPPGGRDGPLVSVIVPARDEAVNIERCLDSLTSSHYPHFEIVVVDDQSTDGTGDLARAIDVGNARRVEVVDGAPLPPGWLGKPWACHQGVAVARGELLLFTDADTWHDADLMERAVAALFQDEADAVTVLGTQEMETFWERVVQPQIFFGMAAIFNDTRAPFRRRRWRRSIANGQYFLFRAAAYRELGGHEAVRGEVAEDLRLAQLMIRGGRTLSVRDGRRLFSTRMYRSLGHLIEGWSKNTARGARLVGGQVGSVALFVGSLLVAPLVWLLPPLLVLAGGMGWVEGPVLLLAALATTINVAMWSFITWQLGAPARYGLIYPLGAAVAWYVVLRSLLRGARVEWKGREYEVDAPS